MTLFRKYYREANNDIKPDEAFVNSVIANAKRRKPPVYARYTKYAAAAAAAIVLVSGAVLSMPVWQQILDNTDGVIVEDAVTETAKPEKPAKAADSLTENTAESIPRTGQTGGREEAKPPQSTARQSRASENTSEHSYSVPQAASGESAPLDTEKTDNAQQSEPRTDSAGGQLESEVADTSEAERREPAAPTEDDVFVAEQFNASTAVTAKMAKIPDNDIPAPSGYYCTSAEPNGYTFVNDDGAVIVVEIRYGGEEREPYIEEDGDTIYAAFTSYGMTVTINASGAERAAVEEIIGTFR